MNETAPQTKSKPFFSVGRIILWCVMLVGGIVACGEGWALYGWTSTRSGIWNAINEANSKPGDSAIKKDELEEFISGSPARNMLDEKREQFVWKGWVKEYSLTLTYGMGGRVASLE